MKKNNKWIQGACFALLALCPSLIFGAPTPTPTATPTFTSTFIFTPTSTVTGGVFTSSPTPTVTGGVFTNTPTLTSTSTHTDTPTFTPTITATSLVMTATPSLTPTPTATNSPTVTVTPTATASATNSPIVIFTLTATPTSTSSCCQGVTALTGQSGQSLNGAGMVVDYGSQRLYAANFFNNDIQVFDSQTFSPVTFFSNLGSSGSLLNPLDTALDSAGNLYVAAEGNQAVEKFDANFNYVGAIAAGQGLSVVGVCVQGNSVFISTVQDFIYEYTGSGSSYSAGPSFGGPGTLNHPNEMVRVGNGLYVADTFNGQVVKFDVTNPPASPVTVQTSLFFPTGLRTDLAGNFYVAESDNGGAAQFVDRYDPTFTIRESQCPLVDVWGPAVNNSGQVFVSGLNSFAVTVLQGCVVEPVPTATPSYQGPNPPGTGQDFIYPSPAKGTTAHVVYFMTGPGRMKMTIWNEAAERRAEVTDLRPAGSQSTSFDISGWASGVYFYALTLSYDNGQVQKITPQKFAIIH